MRTGARPYAAFDQRGCRRENDWCYRLQDSHVVRSMIRLVSGAAKLSYSHPGDASALWCCSAQHVGPQAKIKEPTLYLYHTEGLPNLSQGPL